MNSDLLAGQLGTSSRLAARFDPRTRILIFLTLAVIIMVTLRLEAYLAISVVALLALLALPESRPRLLSLVLPLLTMVALTSLLHIVFPPTGGESLLRLGPVQITDIALWRAAMFSWRIVLFMLLAVLLTAAISADELAQACWRGLDALRLPLAGIGAALFLAIRFLPELAQHYQQIRSAQQLRGANFSGGMLQRVRRSLPLVVPVVVAALRKANSLSDCLAVRGWGASRRRTFYGEWRLRTADWLLLCGFLLLLAAIAILTK